MPNLIQSLAGRYGQIKEFKEFKEFNVGSWLALQVKTRRGAEYPTSPASPRGRADCGLLELLQLLELLIFSAQTSN
jgi:hypothetical protein